MLIYLAYAMSGTDHTEPPEVREFREFCNSLGHVTFSPCFHNPVPDRPLVRGNSWPDIDCPLWDWLDERGGVERIRRQNPWLYSRHLSPLGQGVLASGCRAHEVVNLDLNLMDLAELVVINLRPSRAGVPQEQLYAWSHDKRVVLVRHETDYNPSFWSLVHADATYESYPHLMTSGEVQPLSSTTA